MNVAIFNTALNIACALGIAGVIYLMAWARRRDREAVALAYTAGIQEGQGRLITSLTAALAQGESLHDWVVATVKEWEQEEGTASWPGTEKSTESR